MSEFIPFSLFIFCSIFFYIGMLPPISGVVVYTIPSSSKSRLEIYIPGGSLARLESSDFRSLF
jgi:hypothetical protein